MAGKRMGKPPRLYEIHGGHMSAKQFAERMNIPKHRAWYYLRKTGGDMARAWAMADRLRTRYAERKIMAILLESCEGSAGNG